jgi:flagellar hook-basal body complex protein FliE
MAIPAIGAVTGALPTLPTMPTTQTAAVADPTSSFGSMLGNAMDGLQATQAKADNLAVQAVTGQLTDVHDYMIASTEASLATDLTVSVRNKAVEAFNSIMTMQF